MTTKHLQSFCISTITNAVLFGSIAALQGQWYGTATILEIERASRNSSMGGRTSMGGLCLMSDAMLPTSMADFARFLFVVVILPRMSASSSKGFRIVTTLCLEDEKCRLDVRQMFTAKRDDSLVDCLGTACR